MSAMARLATRCGLFTFVALHMCVFAFAGTVKQSHLFVDSMNGTDVDNCGSTQNPCASVIFAATAAAANTRIYVMGGSYECGAHITVPVSISAIGTGGVFFRCKGKRRGLWFDGVPAQVEGIHIEEGYGEGAGGILVTLFTEHPSIANVISYSTFTSCVGVPSALFDGAAGAVLISYAKVRNPRPYAIESTRFELNYARGDVAPSGAVGIHLPRSVKETPNERCSVFTIDRADSNDAHIGLYSGVYRAVEGMSINGRLVYNTLGRRPTERDDDVRWVAMCPQTNLYGFFMTSGVQEGPIDGCDADISGMIHTEGVPLFDNEWWLARHSLTRAFLSLRCQQDALTPKVCDHFYPINVPAAQQMRQAVFSRIPGLDIAERPSFRAVDIEDPHWVWYCEALSEWIFTDTDPAEIDVNEPPAECRRGIASTPTLAMHPMLVDYWRVWNNITSSWQSAPSRRTGGMQLRCLDPDEMICPTVQIINANTDGTVFHGPVEPSSLSFPRAVYTAYHTQPPQYMSFCRKFNEWMITNDDPTKDPQVSQICERSFSSLQTAAPTPEEAGRWAVFGQTSPDWQISTMDVGCATGCHVISLFSTLDRPCSVCADYAAAGIQNGSRFYHRMEQYSHHLIVQNSARHWVVLTEMANSLYGPDKGGLLISDAPVDDLMGVKLWLRGPFGADHADLTHIIHECAALQNCSSFNVTHPVHPAFNGVYERTSDVRNRRPCYRSKQQAEIYFDHELSRWILKHPAHPRWHLASGSTRTFTPGSLTRWNYIGRIEKEGDKPTYTPSKHSLSVICEGTEASRLAASPSRSSDLIIDSSFYGNVALSSLQDNTAVAGAFMIHYKWLPYGVATRGTLRDVTFTNNEAVMPFTSGPLEASGALSIRNPLRIMHYVTLQDVSASSNVGEWGGALSFTGMTVSLIRVTLRNNHATLSGGAIAAWHSYINASHSTCINNAARLHGGCAEMGTGSRLYVSKSELVGNSAGVSGGVLSSRGYVYVHSSRIDKMNGMAFTGSVLHLVDSSLFCSAGRAMTFIGGFGCQHDTEPVPLSLNASAPTDTAEAWWIYVANTTSQIAQVMLTITMAVFVLQYFITNRDTNFHRPSGIAARWHASQAKEAPNNQREGKKQL